MATDNNDITLPRILILLLITVLIILFLPAVSSLVGIRTGSGMEAAIGPNISLSGIGMVFTLGKNFRSGDLNFPVNIAFVPGKSSAWGDGGGSTGARISLIIGFNMSK